jgi:hypothetical protein
MSEPGIKANFLQLSRPAMNRPFALLHRWLSVPRLAVAGPRLVTSL